MTREEIDALPDELKQQLSKDFLTGGTGIRPSDEPLMKMLREGPKSLDELIVGYYMSEKQVLKRPSMVARLSKLAKSRKVVNDGRGRYQIPPPSPSEPPPKAS